MIRVPERAEIKGWLCFLYEWFPQPQRLRRKFNCLPTSVIILGAVFIYTTILLLGPVGSDCWFGAQLLEQQNGNNTVSPLCISDRMHFSSTKILFCYYPSYDKIKSGYFWVYLMAEITVFVFFASSEKTKADFGAGGKEPDAIEKLINLQIIGRISSQVNSDRRFFGSGSS